jgi:hypothetical protein
MSVGEILPSLAIFLYRNPLLKNTCMFSKILEECTCIIWGVEGIFELF